MLITRLTLSCLCAVLLGCGGGKSTGAPAADTDGGLTTARGVDASTSGGDGDGDGDRAGGNSVDGGSLPDGGPNGRSADNVQGNDPSEGEGQRGRIEGGVPEPATDAGVVDAGPPFAEAVVVLVDTVQARPAGSDAGAAILSDAFDGSGTEGWGIFSDDSQPPALGSAAVLSVNEAEGEPAPSALSLAVPFGHADERVDLGRTLAGETDLSGHELTAWVRLVSGGPVDENCAFHAWLYAESVDGQRYWAAGEDVDFLAEDGWVLLEFTPDAVGHPESDEANFDATRVHRIGVQFSTGPLVCEE